MKGVGVGVGVGAGTLPVSVCRGIKGGGVAMCVRDKQQRLTELKVGASVLLDHGPK